MPPAQCAYLTAIERAANINLLMNQTRQDIPSKPPKRRRHFLSYKRRWALWGSLFLLIGALGTYNYLTQDHRVRAFLESELSDIVGGPVTVKYASFSIAKGLQVREVTVNVDGTASDDSRLLHAGKLSVSLDLSRLLELRVGIDRVEAEQVRILITEDRSGPAGLP